MTEEQKKKPTDMEVVREMVRIASNKGIGSKGTCTTAADTLAKEVTLGSTFSLVSGATFIVTFQNAITVAGATLAVTHTTLDGTTVTEAAKEIYLNGSALEANIIQAGASILLRYNGTQFDIIGGAGANSGSSFYTPTLNDTPTESTLTYTKDGKTYDFEIGQFCRVADASAPLGYKFYQLFDIAQNGTVAKWNAYATKIPSEYTAPTPKTLAYNTEAQALLNAGSSDDGTIQYSSDGQTWGTDIPTGTDAGAYNVYWRLNGDAQHQDVQPTQIAVTIAKKEVASPTVILSEDEYTYDGTAKEPTVTVKDGDDVIPATDYSVAYSSNTNAGTATVTITSGNGNYTFSTTATFTIAKADGSVTTIPASRGVTYNGNAQIVADAGAGTGTMMYRFGDTSEFSSAIPTLTDAGEYTLYYYAAESENYKQSQTGSITVSVFKAAPAYSSPSAKSLTYTGSAQDLLNAGSTSDGTIQYSGDGGTTWSTAIPQGTNAGDYTPQWKLVGDNNHSDVSAITINVSISKAAPTYTAPTAKTLTYNGGAQELFNAGTSNDGTISYSSDNENWGSSIPQGTNAGSYTVYWKLTGDANHNDVASTAISVSIAKVTPAVTAPMAKTGLVYDGTAQGLVNAGSTDFGTLQYSLDDETYGTGIPSGTNAGDYTVYYKVVGDSNINDVAAQSVSCSIAKVTPTYTAPTGKAGLEPTGSPIELVNAGSTNYGTMQYSLDNSNWSTSIPTATDEGAYTVYWRILGDANVNDVAGTGIEVAIEGGWVDLGLPSGRKWAKGNIVPKSGGGYKIGEPTDYGAYFSWGNIVPHFSSNGLSFDDGYSFDSTNYDASPGKALTADIASNDAAHDAALACLGGSARMPTREEFQELYDNTDREWVAIDGVNGWKFMKKSDHSVFVFFPAEGSGDDASLSGRGSNGGYWSSSYSDSNYAYRLLFDSSLVLPQSYDDRRNGYSVRAVQ